MMEPREKPMSETEPSKVGLRRLNSRYTALMEAPTRSMMRRLKGAERKSTMSMSTSWLKSRKLCSDGSVSIFRFASSGMSRCTSWCHSMGRNSIRPEAPGNFSICCRSARPAACRTEWRKLSTGVSSFEKSASPMPCTTSTRCFGGLPCSGPSAPKPRGARPPCGAISRGRPRTTPCRPPLPSCRAMYMATLKGSAPPSLGLISTA